MEAMKRGYVSMAALPLTDGETVIGSLNIYSEKADGFDADEMRLLTELAGDLSFGIYHQRLKDEHERARRELDLRYSISKIFLTVPDDGMYADVLTVVLDAMKSRYGSFGYINEAGDLICPSMTRDVYERCNVPEKTIVFPRATWGGLWGRSLLERKTLYSNSPYRVPEGHIPITRSISTPIIYQDKLIGHMHVANKESDYDERDVGLLENLAETIAPVLAARLEKQAHEAARQKMQGELEASEKKFKGLADNALVGVVQSTLDGRIIYANNALLEMFEFDSLEEFISADALQRWKNPEDRKKMVEQVKSSGRASFDAEMFTKTGETITIVFSAVISDHNISATVLNITDRKKAEGDVKASEARYRAFFDQSPFGVVIIDAETALPLEFNDIACRQLGYTREEFATLRVGDYEVKETAEEMKRHIAEVLKEGSASFETKHRAKGGEIRDVAISIRTVTLDDKPLFYCIFQDITERKEMGDALRKSNERFDLAVKGTNDGIWDWDIETNANYFSPRFLELLDYGPDELAQELRTFELFLHPEDRTWVFDRVRQHLEDKVPYNVKYRMRAKNGEYRWFHTRGEAMWDQSGKPLRMAGFITDITEQRHAEEALRASEERINEAQRIGKLGFLDWDLIANEIECSDETLRIYGLDTGKKKLKLEEITQLVHPDDVALAVKSMNNAIEKGVEHHIEHRIVRPDGTMIYVDTRGEIIRDANGKPIRMLGTNLDITERKVVEVALQSANEELKTAAANMEKTSAVLLRQEKLASIGTLSAGVAHEILNPLNIIGTITQLMQMDEWPEKTKDNLNEIMAQIRRATKITNNLRMFAHVHKREITAVDVHALFDKTATLIEYDLNLDNIMVDRDYDQDLPLIFVDQDLFAQVFLNLLNNARHALQEVKDRKKSISIKTGAVDGTVEIRLSNNGPRIPEDIIGHIFDPFFTTKDPNKGTGLGLSMAHTFIQDFGGTITVQNETPEGVTFIITLPIMEKKAEEK